MNAGEILHKYGIGQTKTREKILTVLLERKSFTCRQIISRIQCTRSRTNVLRILRLYKSKGFVHALNTTGANLAFFFSEEKYNNDIYFTCRQCKKIFVFPLPVKRIKGIPRQLKIKKMSYIVSGECSYCSGIKNPG